ncbi:hypothetical protein [uncultured Hymenobacter sp.]|uniref:hypothetical protein n=1 Tax=uncultured Hymenobacter sp. TaxID=170016 RepID=UPI0035C9EB5E
MKNSDAIKILEEAGYTYQNIDDYPVLDKETNLPYVTKAHGFRALADESIGLFQDVLLCDNGLVIVGHWLGLHQNTLYCQAPATLRDFKDAISLKPASFGGA